MPRRNLVEKVNGSVAVFRRNCATWTFAIFRQVPKHVRGTHLATTSSSREL